MTPQASKEPDGWVITGPDGYKDLFWHEPSDQFKRNFSLSSGYQIRPVWLSTEPLERLKAIEEWAKELLTKQRKPPQRIALQELQLEMVLIELEKILEGRE